MQALRKIFKLRIAALVLIVLALAMFPRAATLTSPPFLAGGDSELAEKIMNRYFDQRSDGAITVVSPGTTHTQIARSSDLFRLTYQMKKQNIGNVWPISFRQLPGGVDVSNVATPVPATDLSWTLTPAWKRIGASGVLTSGTKNLSGTPLPSEKPEEIAGKRKPNLKFSTVKLSGFGAARENGWLWLGSLAANIAFAAGILLALLVSILRIWPARKSATTAFVLLLIVPLSATHVASSLLLDRHLMLVTLMVGVVVAPAVFVYSTMVQSSLWSSLFLLIGAGGALVSKTLLAHQLCALFVVMWLVQTWVVRPTFDDTGEAPAARSLPAWLRSLGQPLRWLIVTWPSAANRSILFPISAAVLVFSLVMPAAQIHLSSPTIPALNGAGLKWLKRADVQGLGEINPLMMMIREGPGNTSDVVADTSEFPAPQEGSEGCRDVPKPEDVKRCEALGRQAAAQGDSTLKPAKPSPKPGPINEIGKSQDDGQLSPLAAAIKALHESVLRSGRVNEIHRGGNPVNIDNKFKGRIPYRSYRLSPVMFHPSIAIDGAVASIRDVGVGAAGMPEKSKVFMGGMPAIGYDYRNAARKELPLQMFALAVLAFLVSVRFEQSLRNGLVDTAGTFIAAGAALGTWRLLDGIHSINMWLGGRPDHALDAWIPISTLLIVWILWFTMSRIDSVNAPARSSIDAQLVWSFNRASATAMGALAVAAACLISPLWPLRNFGVVLGAAAVFCIVLTQFCLPYFLDRTVTVTRKKTQN